jgi:hypothetical protein
LEQPTTFWPQVLAVIDNDQHVSCGERRTQHLQRLLAGPDADSQAARDNLWQQLRIEDRRKLDVPGAIRVFRRHASGHFDRQPGLADSTRASQREEPDRSEKRRNFRYLPLAAHKTAQWCWQRSGARGNCIRQVRTTAGLNERTPLGGVQAQRLGQATQRRALRTLPSSAFKIGQAAEARARPLSQPLLSESSRKPVLTQQAPERWRLGRGCSPALLLHSIASVRLRPPPSIALKVIAWVAA